MNFQKNPNPSPHQSPSFFQSLPIRFQRKICRLSIRTKIITALALALVLVIGLYSFLIQRLYQQWTQDRLEATHESWAFTTQEWFIRSLIPSVPPKKESSPGTQKPTNAHPSQPTPHPPPLIPTPPDGPKIWVLNAQETVVTSNIKEDIKKRWDPTSVSNRMVTVRNLTNLQECQACHQENQASLGRIVLASNNEKLIANHYQQGFSLLLYGTTITVLILIGMGFCLIRFVRQPLNSIIDLMQQVQKGDFSVRYQSHGRDEVSQLGHYFNRMIWSLGKTRNSLQVAHERQMQQAEKLASVGELASGLAHEIRNPLAGIRTAVQVLAEKVNRYSQGSESKDLKEVVTEVSSQTERVNRLIGDLLQFVRLKEPQTVSCDLRTLMDKCLHLLRPQAEKQTIQITWNCQAQDAWVCADPEQIQQAIFNISLNAIQSMPQGGNLDFHLSDEAKTKMLKLKIKDSGAGMSEETCKKATTPFFTTKPKGTGLGLSITHGIIHRHGGSLEIQSKPGEGTTVTLHLPHAKCQIPQKKHDWLPRHPTHTKDSPETTREPALIHLNPEKIHV